MLTRATALVTAVALAPALAWSIRSSRLARGLVRFWIAGDTRSTTLAYAAVVLPFLALQRAALLATALHAVFYAAVCPMARYSVAVYPACALLAGRGLAVLYRSGSGSPPPPAPP